MLGDFLDNRIRAQRYLLQSSFIVPFTSGSISIVESNNLNRKNRGDLPSRDLVEVSISNVPAIRQECSIFTTSTLILNMEHDMMPFAQPEGCKSVEKAIVYMHGNTMHVFLCEMKSGLNFDGNSKSGIGQIGVYKKIKDSITRFCSFLPMFHDDSCAIQKVRFHGLVFFNHEAIGKVLAKEDSKRIVESMELYRAFTRRNESSDTIIMEDYYGYPHPIKVAFIQNRGDNHEVMNIDFDYILKITGLKN